MPATGLSTFTNDASRALVRSRNAPVESWPGTAPRTQALSALTCPNAGEEITTVSAIAAKRYFIEPPSPQQPDQARRVPAVAALLLDLRIELVDQRRHRQQRAILARFVEADRQILAHPVDREAVIELVGKHRPRAVIHLPRLRSALADHAEHTLDVEAGLLCERDRFRQALHHA